MWLSTTLVLTYGLLLVHVSVVSCYQFGAPRRTSSYGRTYPPPTNNRVMTSADLMENYGAMKIDDSDPIGEAMRTYQRPVQISPPMSMSRYPTGPTITNDDLLQLFNALSGFNTRPRLIIAHQIDERPPYQSRGEWPQYSPYNPTSPSSYSQYGPNRYTGYTPYRYTPEPEDRPAFSGFGTFSPFRQSETQYGRPLPSRGPAPPPRSRSGGIGSFLFGGSSDDLENQPRSAISPIPNATPAPSRVPAPPPRTTSSTSNGMGSSLPANNSSASPPNVPVQKKRKVYSEIDGRRLDGRQTQDWPQIGGYNQIQDAECLGEEFRGILIPRSTIESTRQNLEHSKRLSSVDKVKGTGSSIQFRLRTDERAKNIYDVDMFNQAVREAQGDDDDYDNPDPWTYETTYSKEVLDYNRELHNYYRAKHYAGPLEYMDVIHPESHAYAVKMAKHLAYAGVHNLAHNVALLDRNNWGENLYAEESMFDGRPPAMVVKKALDGWYEEEELFNQYNIPYPDTDRAVTGHFTCMVWRSSKRMGLGLAKHRNRQTNKTTYVAVVNYDPRSNVLGYYDTNVLEPHAYDNGRPLPKAVCALPSKFVDDNDDD